MIDGLFEGMPKTVFTIFVVINVMQHQLPAFVLLECNHMFHTNEVATVVYIGVRIMYTHECYIIQ